MKRLRRPARAIRHGLLAAALGWFGVLAVAPAVAADDSGLVDTTPTRATITLDGDRDKPDNGAADLARASTLAANGQRAEATRLLEQLATRYTDRADVWNNLGVLYARGGHLAAAGDALQRAADLAPGDGMVQRNLGDVYLALANRAYTAAGDTADTRRRQLGALMPVLDQLPTTPGADTPLHPADTTTAAPDNPPAGSAGSAGVANPDAKSAAPAIDTAIRDVLVQRDAAANHGDLAGWLATYSNDYQPNDQRGRVAWLKDQRAALAHPAQPPRHVGNIDITPLDDDRLRVGFDEIAGENGTATPHTAVFVREDDNWRIRTLH